MGYLLVGLLVLGSGSLGYMSVMGSVSRLALLWGHPKALELLSLSYTLANRLKVSLWGKRRVWESEYRRGSWATRWGTGRGFQSVQLLWVERRDLLMGNSEAVCLKVRPTGG